MILPSVGSPRLCVIIFAYGILKCLLDKTFRTILRIFYQYRPRFHTETRRADGEGACGIFYSVSSEEPILKTSTALRQIPINKRLMPAIKIKSSGLSRLIL